MPAEAAEPADPPSSAVPAEAAEPADLPSSAVPAETDVVDLPSSKVPAVATVRRMYSGTPGTGELVPPRAFESRAFERGGDRAEARMRSAAEIEGSCATACCVSAGSGDMARLLCVRDAVLVGFGAAEVILEEMLRIKVRDQVVVCCNQSCLRFEKKHCSEHDIE